MTSNTSGFQEVCRGGLRYWKYEPEVNFGLAPWNGNFKLSDPEIPEPFNSLSRDLNVDWNAESDSRKILGLLVKALGPENVGIENVQRSFG